MGIKNIKPQEPGQKRVITQIKWIVYYIVFILVADYLVPVSRLKVITPISAQSVTKSVLRSTARLPLIYSIPTTCGYIEHADNDE